MYIQCPLELQMEINAAVVAHHENLKLHEVLVIKWKLGMHHKHVNEMLRTITEV